MPANKVNSLQMASRRALLEAQPTTKWINVVETTHGVPIQKRILVRNNIRDVDQLMMTMTNRLQPEKGAIRNLYTPSGGTQVTSLDQLNPDGCKYIKTLICKTKLKTLLSRLFYAYQAAFLIKPIHITYSLRRWCGNSKI